MTHFICGGRVVEPSNCFLLRWNNESMYQAHEQCGHPAIKLFPPANGFRLTQVVNLS